MKRVMLFLTAAAALAFGATAADPAGGVFALARYVPFNADAYVAVALDDSHLTALDGLIGRIDRLAGDLGFPAAVPPTVRELLAGIFSDGDQNDVDTKLAWAGEAIAMATSERDASGATQSLLIVPLDDRAAAEADAVADQPRAVFDGVVGRFTLYRLSGSQYMLIADDVLILANGVVRAGAVMLAEENYPRLSDVTQYATAVSTLPTDGYTLGLYLNARRLIEGEATFGTEQAKAALEASVAAGGKLLDGETLTLDAAVVPDVPFEPPLTINPDFAHFVPGTLGASIHGADLAAIVNTAIDVADVSSEQDVRGVVSSTFQMLGLDFDGFFRWAKGDFALFASLDMTPPLFAEPRDLSAVPQGIEAGIVVEAVDPQQAQDFARGLIAVLRVSVAQVETLRLREEDVNGTAVSVIEVDTTTPSGSTATFELGIAATDAVFVFGTIGAVRDVLSGAPGLPQQLAYIDSARHWLPDANTRWVMSGDTFANVAAFWALLTIPTGPGDAATLPTAAQVDTIIDRLSRFIDHAAINTAVTDEGSLLIRATIGLGE
jgi:hypothetical protein